MRVKQIISTEFGVRALKNKELFQEIITHREKFTPIKTVNYSDLQLDNLKIIPPKDFFEKYEKDYIEMQENMIYEESIGFKKLIDKIVAEYPSGNKQ